MKGALVYLTAQAASGVAARIVFIGAASRTWFADWDAACAVMEILRDTAMFRPVHSDPRGFDLMVSEVARLVGLASVVYPPEINDEAGRALRDAEMLDGASMVVAFPPEPGEYEKGTKPWTEADPRLVPTVRALQLPVLVVRRSGTTTWIPGDET